MYSQGARRWIVAAILLLVTGCTPDFGTSKSDISAKVAAASAIPRPVSFEIPEAPLQLAVSQALEGGVVIVISKASQQMYVFQRSKLWAVSPVSTGKKGKETPSGVFAILQKKEFHRSNLYSNAPMPFMQRLTWDGIAIHAGRLPGYPASHGCIRLPDDFAQALFQLTGFESTAVIVVNEAIENEQAALAKARATEAIVPIEARTLKWAAVQRKADGPATKPVLPPKPATGAADENGEPITGPTIQLAAALSESDAKAHWEKLVRGNAKLAEMRMSIQQATVNGQRYHRLRATSPDARAVCDELQQAGTACFFVT